jgi:hypothetical protein
MLVSVDLWALCPGSQLTIVGKYLGGYPSLLKIFVQTFFLLLFLKLCSVTITETAVTLFQALEVS